jgi:NADPH:quinone reductase-like Zn-dependent oxidoreductase
VTGVSAQTMKAMTVRSPGGLDNLVLVERPVPRPGPGEVLIRVRASSLNYHDYVIASGIMPVKDGVVAMSDAAGEIAAVGANVVEFAPGDRVMSLFYPAWQGGEPDNDYNTFKPGENCDGWAAEYVAVPASWVTRMPYGYDFCEAASLTCAGLTAWAGVTRDGNIDAGRTVLVQGTGGVSIFALQFAKAAGATVIATSSSEEKIEKLKALGADHCINYREVPDWGRLAREITGGQGVDLVVEVGGAGTFAQSVDACRTGGRISLIGILGGMGGDVPLAKVFVKQITVFGLAVGSRENQLAMIAQIDRDKIRPVIDRTFPLSELADAYRHQESGKHFGKICIEI